jgi:hypothetical protein
MFWPLYQPSSGCTLSYYKAKVLLLCVERHDLRTSLLLFIFGVFSTTETDFCLLGVITFFIAKVFLSLQKVW